MRQISQTNPDLSLEAKKTLQSLCFNSKNEYYLDIEQVTGLTEIDQSYPQIEAKLKSLTQNSDAFNWETDARTQEIVSDSSRSTMASLYNVFTADEVNRYFWQTEIDPNLTIADKEAFRIFNDYLSVYHVHEEQLKTSVHLANQYQTLYAIEQMISLYEVKNFPTTELQKFHQHISDLISSNLAQASLDQASSFTMLSIGLVNPLLEKPNVEVQSQVRQAILRNIFINQAGLAGFSGGAGDTNQRFFSTFENGYLFGILALKTP